MTRFTPGAALCKPRRTIGLLEPWEPDDVAEDRILVAASAHLLRTRGRCRRDVAGIGHWRSRHGNEDPSRKQRNWRPARRVRTVAIGRRQRRVVDGSPR